MTFLSDYRVYYLESTNYYRLVWSITDTIDRDSLKAILKKTPSYLEIIRKGEIAAQSYLSRIAIKDLILLGKKIDAGLVHAINSENVIRLEFFLRVLELSSFPSFTGLTFLFQSFYKGSLSTSFDKDQISFAHKIKHLVEYMLDILISIHSDKTIPSSIIPSIISLAGHTFDKELEILDINVKALVLLGLIDTELAINGLKKIADSTDNKEIAAEANMQLSDF